MWKSREEIVKTYTDHLDSLTSWGGEYDEFGLIESMNEELAEWDKEHTA